MSLATVDLKEQFLTPFEDINPRGGKIAEDALEALQELEIPDRTFEDWKYSPPAAALKPEYTFGENNIPEGFKNPWAALDAYQMVFINGYFNSELSDLPKEGKIIIKPLAEAESEEAFQKHFAQHIATDTNVFTALNTAFAQNGAFVFLPKGSVLNKPLMVLHVLNTEGKNVLVQSRNLFVAEENSQARILQDFITYGEGHSLLNSVTECSIAESAHLDHYRLQNDTENASQISRTAARQADKSVFSDTTITLGGKYVRNDLTIKSAEHCETFMNGLYLLRGRTHADNHTVVDHEKANSESNELYKGVLSDHSRAVFNGKIFVRQDAQKTNAFQNNRNILLSDNAVVDTKPQLEIWADDVKCSHGATVGTLDLEPMFYLRSRGIPEDKAKNLLLQAFAGDVLQRVKIPEFKAHVEEVMRKSI